MARAARAAGFEVHVAAAVTDDDAANRGEDFFSSGLLVPIELCAGARFRYLAADALAAAARAIWCRGEAPGR